MSAAAGVEAAPYTVVPMDRLRRVTGKRMRASVEEKPHVTLHRYARVDAFNARREQERIGLDDEQRKAVTLTAVLVAVVARAMARNPRVNGRVEEGEIRLYNEVNVGVAVEVPGGLTVPVIHGAAELDIVAVGTELRRLADAAKAGGLRPEDMSDATFTVTNLGSYGVELFTPIISPPQLAILGVGASSYGVDVVDGVIASFRRIGLSLSFDHAASDGSDAAKVLTDLVAAIEDPGSVLDGSGA